MKPCVHGHTAGRMSDGRCRECQRLRNNKRYASNPGIRRPYNVGYYAKNKDKIQQYRNINRERDKEVRRVNYAKFRARELIKSAKHRASKSGIAFNLDEHIELYQSIIDAGFCQATGLPFDLETKASHSDRNPFAPSLDRIEPELGYICSNVRVVLWAFNRALADWGVEVYAMIATAYLNRQR